MNAQAGKHKLAVVRTLLETGLFEPSRPDRVLRSLAALRRWGATPAGTCASAAARYGERVALVDERGSLTFRELHARTNALARELRRAGVREGDGVAIMSRNHRGFVQATLACSKLGAGALYLNTSFASPQIVDVLEREGSTAVIYDAEFAELVRAGAATRLRFIAWSEPGSLDSNGTGDPLLEEPDRARR